MAVAVAVAVAVLGMAAVEMLSTPIQKEKVLKYTAAKQGRTETPISEMGLLKVLRQGHRAALIIFGTLLRQLVLLAS